MVWLFLILFVSWWLASRYSYLDAQRAESQDDVFKGKPFCRKAFLEYFAFLTLLILFAGTRQFGNDTRAYIKYFLQNAPTGFQVFETLDFSLGENFGFRIYESMIKWIFAGNFTWFLTITAIITNVSFITFIRRYSKDFGLNIFLYIATTFYAFTFAAQKQCLAMAIAIWIIPAILQKRWRKAFLLFCLALTFHPYILSYLVIPFVVEPVWKKKSLLIVAGGILCSMLLHILMPIVLEFTASLGDSYELETFVGEVATVNVFRFLVFLSTPLLTWIYRNDINRNKDIFLQTCCNLSLISLFFMFLALFSDANSFGRLAAYFEPFSLLALTGILTEYVAKQNQTFFKNTCICAYMAFYYTFFLKYSPGLFGNIYLHTSLGAFFK